MSREICDAVITEVATHFGPPSVFGSLQRWAIQLEAEQPLSYVIAIDRCDQLPVRIWVFDPLQLGAAAMEFFAVNSAAEAAMTVRQVRNRVIQAELQIRQQKPPAMA